MQMASWLRAEVWRADDWRSALRAALAAARARPDAERALDLARALEHCEPDRSLALDAYRLAWSAGQAAAALGGARRIAREIRAYPQLAELSMHEHERSGEATALFAAACAWIDAGEPTRAVRSLSAAARARGDERITSLGAACVGELRDPKAEVARWFERATAHDEPAAATQAARVARAAGMPDEAIARLLRVALDRWPADDDVAMLVEDLLLRRGDPDELMTFYRRRLGAVVGARPWADEVRAASSRLVVRGTAPGLGLRLARKGLEHAYGAGLVDIPGHLASWTLLAEHARAVNACRELMPLAVQALRLPLPDDDRMWLARLGLEVAWKGAHDADAAAAYAAIVIELDPEHDDVRDFVADLDIDIDVDVPAEDDPSIAEIAMSLVYLDEHGGRLDGIAESAKHAAGLAAAVAEKVPEPPAPPAPPHLPEQDFIAIADEAALQTETVAAVTASVPDPAPTPAEEIREETGPTPRVAAEPPSLPAAQLPGRPLPVIPGAALAALRRIGARVRPPTPPPIALENLRDRAARVILPVDCTVELHDGRTVRAMVRDLSATGLYILLTTELGLGDELTIDLSLPGKDGLASSRHRAWSKVARKGDGGYGLVLLDPEPELVEAIRALTE